VRTQATFQVGRAADPALVRREGRSYVYVQADTAEQAMDRARVVFADMFTRDEPLEAELVIPAR